MALPQDARAMMRLLLYGSDRTRRKLADELVSAADDHWIGLLAQTVRSTDSPKLRARCLEVLGLAAGRADPDMAGTILASLGVPEPTAIDRVRPAADRDAVRDDG